MLQRCIVHWESTYTESLCYKDGNLLTSKYLLSSVLVHAWTARCTATGLRDCYNVLRFRHRRGIHNRHIQDTSQTFCGFIVAHGTRATVVHPEIPPLLSTRRIDAIPSVGNLPMLSYPRCVSRSTYSSGSQHSGPYHDAAIPASCHA